MAVSARPNTEPIYRFFDLFRNEVLEREGSLFTPGRAIWTAANLRDLRTRFLGNPDTSGDNFEAKFRRQLKDAPDATIQLAGELLYAHLVIAADLQGKTKRALVKTVLGWSPEPVALPEELSATLDHGLANTGQAFKMFRPNQLAMLIDFALAWRELAADQRAPLFEDPWAFKAFLFEIPMTAAYAQRNALLHFVHPGSFEPIVSDKNKKQIVAVLGRDIPALPADVDEALLRLRETLELEVGAGFDFYRPPVVERWQEKKMPPEPPPDDPTPPATRAWLVRGSNVGGVNLIPEWVQKGYCSVRWSEVGEIEPGTSRQAMFEVMREAYPDESEGWVRSSVGNVARFLNDMTVGDVVVTADGAKVYVGTIESEPTWVPDHPGATRQRAVEWLNPTEPIQRSDLSERAFSKLRTLLTVSEISEDADEFRTLAGGSPGPGPGQPPPPPPALQLRPADPALAKKLLLPQDWLAEVIDLLDERKQVVFYGPPGTGKTYVAQKLAEHLTEDGGNFTLVQFHPSYAYEDFFEGFRPRAAADGSGALRFELVPGPLARLAKAAREDPGNPYVLIIDELNRANLAKVFGELYFLLEYRNHAIQLQYSPEVEFELPENLFLIGTMNTADRSIALADAAMRRRFYFVEFSPTEHPIDRLLTDWLASQGHSAEAADLLRLLNERIADPDFAVGPSYLMNDRAHKPGGLERVWDRAILPLLKDRYFGVDVDVAKQFGLAALRASAGAPHADDWVDDDTPDLIEPADE